MVDLKTRPAGPPDPATRSAALWATVIAVPVALVVGLVIFALVRPEPAADAKPAASASAPVVVPTTPVQMAAPKLSERAAAVCLAVTSQLPVTVRGLPARVLEQDARADDPRGEEHEHHLGPPRHQPVADLQSRR